MINQQLLDYVRAQKSAGLSKEAIIQALGAGGWTTADVNEAFMAIDGVKIPPPPPPPPPAQPMAPRTIVPPIQMQQTPQAQPVIIPPTSAQQRPVVSSAEFATVVVPKRRSWLAITLITIFLIIIAGGIAAAVILGPANVVSMIPGLNTFIPGASQPDSTEQTQLQPEQQEQTPAPLLDTSINSDTTGGINVATTSTTTGQ